MKKIIHILGIAFLLLSISGCSKTAVNEEQMLQIIVKEEGISDKLQIQSIGTITLDHKFLICAMTGNENQKHQYYAAEFKQENHKYKFVHIYQMYERGMDMYSLNWSDGYVFVSNNKNSKSLQIRFLHGEQKDELINIDKIPFMYYLKINKDNFSMEYYFLDKDGKSISL